MSPLAKSMSKSGLKMRVLRRDRNSLALHRPKLLSPGIWAMIFLASLAFLIWGLPRLSEGRAEVLLPSIVAAGIAVLGVTRARSWRRGIDLLEPPVFVSLWCLCLYLFPTIVWAFGLSYIRVNAIISDDLPYWLSMSSWLTAASLGAIWLGYLSVTRRKRVDYRPPVRATQLIRVRLAIALYACGVLVRFLFFTYGIRGNAGVFREYLSEGAAAGGIDQLINVVLKCLTATGPALFIYILGNRYAKQRRLAWILTILVCEILLGILSGSRAGVILTLFFFAAYYRYSTGRYPSKVWVPIAVVLLLLSVPIINQLRNETTDISAMNPNNFMNVLGGAARETVERGAVAMVDDVMAVAFDRQMAVFQMQGAVMRIHPHIMPFKGIEPLVLFPVFLIPRALWPGKPVLFNALDATNLYAGETALNFSSPILPAELYSLAGWPTAVFGMFLFGVIQGLAYRYLVGNGRALELVLFTMIFFELSHWEGQLPEIMAVLMLSIPLFWLFLRYILFRRSRSYIQVASPAQEVRGIPDIRRIGSERPGR